MIHHFARALAVRENRAATAGSSAPVQQSLFWPTMHDAMPKAASCSGTTAPNARPAPQAATAARVRRDPSDVRRALISGRFADVCAALDRMVGEFEPV
jgi:hypothetical protein